MVANFGVMVADVFALAHDMNAKLQSGEHRLAWNRHLHARNHGGVALLCHRNRNLLGVGEHSIAIERNHVLCGKQAQTLRVSR